MECPLKFNSNAVDKECKKDSCAWWLGDIQMCCIRELALQVRYTQFRIQDLCDCCGRLVETTRYAKEK